MESEKMKAEFVEVTARLAAEWLTLNTSNRQLSQVVVKRYAEQLRNGGWIANGESIQFSSNGKLLDGQHRLQAIVDTEVPVTMLVVRNVCPEAQSVINIGKRRSPADSLSIRGCPNNKTIAAAIRFLYHYDKDSMTHFANPIHAATTTQILDLYDRVGNDLQDGISIAQSVRDLSPASAMVFCFYVFRRLDEPAAIEFFERLAQGANLSARSSILVLRNRLMSSRSVKHKLTPLEIAAVTIKAWNAWRKNREVQYLSWRSRSKTRGAEDFPIAR